MKEFNFKLNENDAVIILNLLANQAKPFQDIINNLQSQAKEQIEYKKQEEVNTDQVIEEQ